MPLVCLNFKNEQRQRRDPQKPKTILLAVKVCSGTVESCWICSERIFLVSLAGCEISTSDREIVSLFCVGASRPAKELNLLLKLSLQNCFGIGYFSSNSFPVFAV